MSDPDELDLDLALSRAFRNKDAASESGDRCVHEVRFADPMAAAFAARLDATGRYRVTGELGRGGVGVVFEAHDSKLGREIAIKVVPAAVGTTLDARVLEEARIAGRLEHPAVVPIHDLGLLHDDLFYFTMKIVRGETLRARLARREDASEEQDAVMDVFRDVVDAIAFAHRHDVIHRDIKPANVMIGDFGEVQVMDWGLAKVLHEGGVEVPGHSPLASSPAASVDGMVKGTPAYMSPEQARGEIDRIDARTDVFALGGILCEILTEEPPFSTSRTTNAVEQAAEGALEDAHARLAACSGDADLVALARDCLSPAPEDRPDTAAELADRLSTWHRRRSERVREAERTMLAAAARVEHERKLRIRTIVFAAIILGTMVTGFICWSVFDRNRRERIAESERGVDRLIDEGRLALLEASDGRRVEDWQNAVTSIDRARSAAETADIDRADVLSDLKRRAAAGLREAQHVQERAQLAQRTVAQLEELRQFGGSNRSIVEIDAEYKRVLGEFGLDLEPPSIEKSAAFIRDSTIAEEILDGLDDWSRFLIEAGIPVERVRPLGRIASRADRDAYRSALRDAILSEDSALAVVRDGDPSRVSISTALMMGWVLARHRDVDGAVTVLLAVQRRHPDELRINFQLGYWLTRTSPPRNPEALTYFRAAEASSPRHLPTRVNIAVVLSKLDRLKEAGVYFEEILDEWPEYVDGWLKWAWVFVDRRELDEAERILKKGMGKVEAGRLHMLLARTSLLRGDDESARSASAEAVRLEPLLPAAHELRGDVLQRLGDTTQAIASWRRAARLRPTAAVHRKIVARSEGPDRIVAQWEAFEAGMWLPRDLAEWRRFARQCHSHVGLRQAAEVHRAAIDQKIDGADRPFAEFHLDAARTAAKYAAATTTTEERDVWAARAIRWTKREVSIGRGRNADRREDLLEACREDPWLNALLELEISPKVRQDLEALFRRLDRELDG